METAKVFENGRSQAVRLPKQFRFNTDEVFIRKIGSAVMLIPKQEDALWEMFMSGLNNFSEDFMKDGREPEISSVREDL